MERYDLASNQRKIKYEYEPRLSYWETARTMRSVVVEVDTGGTFTESDRETLTQARDNSRAVNAQTQQL